MRYVDVILPLPLDGLFTYTLPDALEDKVQAGMRVLVPLGRSKTYTAMVLRLHDQEPAFTLPGEASAKGRLRQERGLSLPFAGRRNICFALCTSKHKIKHTFLRRF